MGELVIETKETELPVSSIKDSKVPVERHFDENIVAQLMESIKQLGLLHAITVSEDMYLIAGRHRLAAHKRLGKKTIAAKVLPIKGIIAELATIDENLLSASLTYLEESEHMRRREEILVELGQRASLSSGGKDKGKGASAQLRTSSDDASDKTLHLKTTDDIASEMGMAKRTAQEHLQVAKSIAPDVRNIIRGTDISDNKSELIRLAKIENVDEQKKIAQKVASGEFKTVKDAVSEVLKEKQREEFDKLSEEVKKLPDTIKLFNQDFFEFESTLKDNSIDAIITDVPYVDDWKENIAPFMSVANRILKPGGVVITYLGHIRLPEFFDALRECTIEFKDNALEFYWQCALAHKGHLAAVHPVGAMCGYKPILIAMKPKRHKPYKMYNDLIEGGGEEKELHDWQQATHEILPLIDAFTKPGDTILDPFMGSGSTGVVAKLTARRFIGVEIEKKTYQLAYKNILQTEK